jgi:hypothetical protein
MRVTLLVLVMGCAENNVPSAAEAQRAIAISNEYKSWGRVDDELRWAPYLCRQPSPGVAWPSASSDGETHGQKLYSVFAKDHAAYPMTSNVGQVVVKESYQPELVTDPNFQWSPPWNGSNIEADHFYPYAQKDGKTYKAASLAGLFLMYRVDPATPNSDDGWVYAIVSPDKKVTSSGKIALCVGCHENADHGRLFGVPQSPHWQ